MSLERVRIQPEDFSLDDEWRRMRAGLGSGAGAVSAFVGLVRDQGGGGECCLELEHYPGMTESSIEAIVARAERRWNLSGVLVIHRIGRLRPTDQIVLVLCASGHREEAFAACEFIMDFLKTDAIFWKKETGPVGSRWVASTRRDLERAAGWGGTRPPEPAPGK